MSGPCTDCGGPDYQTLVARIADLEDANEAIRALCELRAPGLRLRLEQAEAALAERDEALTIAWRLCLQEAWGDLREHLDCTASVGPVTLAEEGTAP